MSVLPSYQFRSASYRSVDHLCDAMADAFITAGGANGAASIAETLATRTDKSLALETVCEFGLAQRGEGAPSHMVANRYRLYDLEEAFTRFRAAFIDPETAANELRALDRYYLQTATPLDASGYVATPGSDSNMLANALRDLSEARNNSERAETLQFWRDAYASAIAEAGASA